MTSSDLERLADLVVAKLRETIFLGAPPPAPGPLPGLLSKKAAAKVLGVGVTKLGGMIARREIQTTMVGQREMVPLSELERVARPRPKAVGGGRTRSAPYDAKAEALAGRERLGLRKKS